MFQAQYVAVTLLQAGIEKCSKLRVLFASNNKIKDWAELDRLSGLAELEDLLLVGNPLYNEWKDNGALPQYRIEVCRLLHAQTVIAAF
jgi:dynein light chain 1